MDGINTAGHVETFGNQKNVAGCKIDHDGRIENDQESIVTSNISKYKIVQDKTLYGDQLKDDLLNVFFPLFSRLLF